jgi:hypothetical protein
VYNTPLTAGSACNTCDIPAGSVNFTSYLYYVQVTMKRHTTSERPKINTLRIY